MKKIWQLFFLILITFNFIICSQDKNSLEEWEYYRRISIDDGIVYEENDHIYLIEPLIMHVIEDNPEVVGYKKSELEFIDINSKTYRYVKDLIMIYENVYCSECISIKNKIDLFDFAEKKTRYPQVFWQIEEGKEYNIKISDDINIRIIPSDFPTMNKIEIKYKKDNQTKYYELVGALLCAGIRNGLFYVGYLCWGAHSYGSDIYIWKLES